MAITTFDQTRLVRRHDGEILVIEPWGDDSLRVRVTRNARLDDTIPTALDEAPAASSPRYTEGETSTLTHGRLTASVNREGWITFTNQKGEVLLQEYWRNRNRLDRFTSPLNVSGRELQGNPGGEWKATVRFEAQDGEKIFGMGQYQDPYLDKKGCTLELAHRNAQSSVPFYTSSRGYGFLWNNPAVGRVTFGRNVTEWTVQVTAQIDYWITAGDTPAEIQERYTEVTGRVPMMPEFGLGFTQCRMRYRNQAELMAVAREHKRRGLPMDLIVADFFHWTIQGDFRFDPTDWPDVPAMVKELKGLGIELMVSIWPTVDTRSENRAEMEERGLLIQTDRGPRINMNWMGETCFFDATNPEARAYLWQKAKENYLRHGIQVFWLDEAEPEFGLYDFDLYRYHLGPALKVTNLYPRFYAQGFFEGLRSEGVENPLCLVRTAWAGSQKYGALVWSGDIHSSYRSMREQLAAGLSMAMAGIPWWTTDIGGFHSGYTENEDFRELLVRWFQWGTFCPVFRLHGDRLPYRPPVEPVRNGIQQFGSGSDNEIWSFGDQAYPVLVEHLHLRERLRPYLRSVHRAAHERGTPVMRPLFYDYPGDPEAWNQETVYLLGPDLLVAPILEARQTHRSVYLPAGARWTNAHSGQTYEGGQSVDAPAPYEHIPLFVREGGYLTCLPFTQR